MTVGPPPKGGFSQTPAQFTLNIDAMVKDLVEDEVVLFLKKLSLDALRGCVMKSPVDTGRFRGNWNVGIGSQDLSVSEREEKIPVGDDSGERILTGALEIEGTEDLTVIWITNNLPYAEMLEHGWSLQAVNGMVAMTLAELETMDYDA